MWSSKIAAFSAFLTILSVTVTANIRIEHSLEGPYNEETEGLLYWDLTESTQLGGSHIRLTTDEHHKQGGLWNNYPCNHNNWELQAHFHIHGRGVNLNGDGMAFWYVRDARVAGPVFGSKDYFSGLGVFIDTYENQKQPHEYRFPYISAMINNGSLHYDNEKDGAGTLLGGCHVPIRNLDVPTRIAISYINDILAVYLDFEGFGQWKICFREERVHLPTGYRFGVSASTSDFTDNHDVIAITTLNMDPPDQNWYDKSSVMPEAEDMKLLEAYLQKFVEEQVKLDKLHEEEEKLKHKIHEEEEKIEHMEKIHQEQEKVDIKREVHKEDAKESDDDKPKVVKAEEEEVSSATSTSLLRKFIYFIGAAILILVAISMYRKYSERRRERMHKRLF